MERKKYFISSDLEDTFEMVTKKTIDTNILEYIRKDIIKVLTFSFDRQVDVCYVNYDEIKDFYLEFFKSIETWVVLNLLGWIYISDSEIKKINDKLKIFNLDITRTYTSYNELLNRWEYRYYNRFVSEPIDNVIEDFFKKYKIDIKDNIYILDDWLFSWGSLKKIIKLLLEKNKNLKIKWILTYFNFSWKDNLMNIPIFSKIKLDSDRLIDWLDERDLFLSVYLYWASFIEDDKINWVPYFWSPTIANIKASIPNQSAINFVKRMFDINIEFWKNLWGFNVWNYCRNYWLIKKFGKDIDIIDLLKFLKDKNI